MKKLISVLIAVTFLFGCVSSRKYSEFVNKKTITEPIISDNQDWLTINAPEFEENKNTFKKIKYSFIPAILYWGWNSTIECKIDPNISANYIKQSIFSAADSLGLKEKLNGQQLTVNLEQLPGQFLYENKGSAIIFIVAYSTTSLEAISPKPIDFIAAYEINNNNGTAIKNGKILIPNAEQPKQNIWKSTKKFTWIYLDDFKKETDRMGKELVKELIKNMASLN